MLGVAPILPSRDLAETAAFYTRLGFTQAGLWPDEYLIVMRGEVGVHFFHSPGLDPRRSIAGCYLYVEDADALYAEYQRLGLPGEGIPRLHAPPEDTDYGLREFAVVDADGNLLRIGSRLAKPG
ncbi:MAG: VOC family protein [Thermoleophilaceae bacterium]|nr:VOC family protein [Thermoleophilaceae bacterium]